MSKICVHYMSKVVNMYGEYMNLIEFNAAGWVSAVVVLVVKELVYVALRGSGFHIGLNYYF